MSKEKELPLSTLPVKILFKKPPLDGLTIMEAMLEMPRLLN